MKRLNPALPALVVFALLSGCTADAPPVSSTADEKAGPVAKTEDGIAWFKGSVDEALAAARTQNKPIFLYWGADWCGGCNVIKSRVFTQRDFIEKSRLFVAIYIDGDHADAARWSDEFDVAGYPAMIMLRPDRMELARFVGARASTAEYLTALDAVLDAARPIDALVSTLGSSTEPLSEDDCRRLAYTHWQVTPDRKGGERARDLKQAADRCPASAREERHRLTLMATTEARRGERSALAAGAEPSEFFNSMMKAQYAIVRDLDSAMALQSVLSFPSEADVKNMVRAGVATREEIYDTWIGITNEQIKSPQAARPDRLLASWRRLLLVKARDGELPAAMIQEARQAAEAALAADTAPSERIRIVQNSTNIYNTIGEFDRSASLLQKELETTHVPYHIMRLLASVSSRQGKQTEALHWLERAYREGPGPATRFNAGVNYIARLAELSPSDAASIRDSTVELIGELSHKDMRLDKRIVGYLDRLSSVLREWNSDGQHEQALQTIRARMRSVCSARSDSPRGGSECSQLLTI